MAQLDVNLKDNKGWSCIKEKGSIATLKSHARKLGEKQAVFRIFEDDILVLVGVTLSSGTMRWGKGNKQPRELCELGTEVKPVKCACGSEAKPVEYNIDSAKYLIACKSESCPAFSSSRHSGVVVRNWNNVAKKTAQS